MNTVRPVDDAEFLSRFVLFSDWVRSDRSLRPDAFTPHPHPDLSLTRHDGYTDAEIWATGVLVASTRPATLHGRADVKAIAFRAQRLDPQPKPTLSDPNHAIVIGWPESKPAKKLLAQEIAKHATFVPAPASEAAK